MSSYDEEVKQLKADAEAEFQKIVAKANRRSDPFRAEREMLLWQLVKARLHKHLSQSTLAKQIGTQQSTISRLENGRSNPSLRTLLAITRALDVDLVLEYKK